MISRSLTAGRVVWSRFALVMTVCAGAAVSLAGVSGPPDAKSTPPVLKGPEVKDERMPGLAPSFGAGKDGQRRFAERIPPEVFRRAVGVLIADDAPAAIKASSDQEAKIKSLVDDFEGRVRDYRKAHATELAQLRKDAGEPAFPGRRGEGRPPRGEKGAPPAGGAGTPPPPGDEMTGPDDAMKAASPEDQKKMEEARAKLRDLMEGAPKIEDIYNKVWAELSAPQRKAVEDQLQVFRDEQAKRREDEYVRQRAGKKKGAPDPAAAPASDGKPGVQPPPPEAGGGKPPPPRGGEGRISPERRERLMKLFERLSPEEQEQLLQRIEQRFQDRAGGDGPKRPPGKGGGKPAPSPDEVKVPSPDSGNK